LLCVERGAEGLAVRRQVETVRVLAGAAGAGLARQEQRCCRMRRGGLEVERRGGDLERDEGCRRCSRFSKDRSRDSEREVPLRPILEGPGPARGLYSVGRGARVGGLEQVGGRAVVFR
jgi:hypothetical protein